MAIILPLKLGADTPKSCCEQKTAELADFTIQSRMKFPAYALNLTE